ncbi:MAG: flavin reductase [Chloroflexi bacterium HGW-Chloroflexi-10]|nr:MAG: flavin reductase [Chloroflexi bacterium HGW-Chloroflexi-10]
MAKQIVFLDIPLEKNMAVNAEKLKEFMRFWTTGVAVVCSRMHDDIHGMTVNSFTSVSIDPPLISVTLAKSTRTLQLVQQSGIFSISILAEDQVEISDRFAGRIPEEDDRFAGLEYKLWEYALPVIQGALAWMSCRVVHTYETDQSILILGQVEGVSTLGGQPLLYHERRYWKLGGE